MRKRIPGRGNSSAKALRPRAQQEAKWQEMRTERERGGLSAMCVDKWEPQRVREETGHPEAAGVYSDCRWTVAGRT